MGKVLTVSIAAYNVEKYIAKTLDNFICDRYAPFIGNSGVKNTEFYEGSYFNGKTKYSVEEKPG